MGRGFRDRASASAAGRKGAAVMRERLGEDVYSRLGRLGGAANRDKHGPGYFSELGRLGAAKRWGRQKDGAPVDPAGEPIPGE